MLWRVEYASASGPTDELLNPKTSMLLLAKSEVPTRAKPRMPFCHRTNRGSPLRE